MTVRELGCIFDTRDSDYTVVRSWIDPVIGPINAYVFSLPCTIALASLCTTTVVGVAAAAAAAAAMVNVAIGHSRRTVLIALYPC